MSHCFFEQERFDEVRFEGNWAFGRVGQGLRRHLFAERLTVGDEGQYAGASCNAAAQENTWLVECGREADWGSFDAFVDALKAANVEAKDGAITYRLAFDRRFVTGWDVQADGQRRADPASRLSDGGQRRGRTPISGRASW